MKINKLYTLSQFVAKMQTEKINDPEVLLFIIFAYNEFLKQPLKKEMFVNEIEKPDKKHMNYRYINWDKGFDIVKYNKDLKAWQEAEKKVMFDLYDIVVLRNDGLYDSKFGTYITEIENNILNDLSIVTNGELKLKNIEI